MMLAGTVRSGSTQIGGGDASVAAGPLQKLHFTAGASQIQNGF
jgi:hypothetical protein